MTDGNTLIVDVVQKGDYYVLNDTPVNMMIAYEVVRRHVTDNGTLYSQLTKKHKTSEGYVFKFDTGDEFTCASDTTYPTSSSISDSAPTELPAVTASDAGKVLTANDSGVWGASELAFYVDFAFDASEQYGIRSALVDTADYKSAVESGKKIRVRIYEENGEEPLQTADAIYIGDTQLIGVSYEMYTATYCDTDAGILKPLLFALSKESNLEEQYATVSNPTLKDRFIVTLTPTALDYSGTMDKTVAEINAAYEAGQEIWFKIAAGTDWTEYPLSRVGKQSGDTYPSFNCNALYDENNVLVMIYTGTTNDGTKQTYSTKVYTLTHAT